MYLRCSAGTSTRNPVIIGWSINAMSMDYSAKEYFNLALRAHNSPPHATRKNSCS